MAALDRLMEARFVTLETLVRFQAEKVALALDAAQRAINKSEAADDKARDRLAEDMRARFGSVNEFRQTLTDQAATFVPRNEFNALKEKHAEDMAALKERLDKAEGNKSGVSNVWAVIVAVAGIAIGVGALVFRNMG